MIKIPDQENVKRAALFSNNLRWMLRNGPIGNSELARKIGVSPAAIGSYARGRVFPNEERIQQIAEALNCSVDELFDDTYIPWNFGGEEDN